MILFLWHSWVKYSTESCGDRARLWREREREREKEREREHCSKWVETSAMKFAIGENIYNRYRLIILDH